MSDTLISTTNTIRHCGVELTPSPDISIPRPAAPEGFRAWLPALVVLIGMPLLALATTKYVLLPPMQRFFSRTAAIAPATPGKITVSFSRTMPGETGIAGSHSIVANFTVVVANDALKDKVFYYQNKLGVIAANELRGKPILDMGKPARNAIRARLLAEFNQALGVPAVKEVYFSAWPLR